ncbi:MAG: acyltransferase [Alphaproteobacteria bacterium]|nr:acyltransferase [Alphaproteobacteria bacterium]
MSTRASFRSWSGASSSNRVKSRDIVIEEGVWLASECVVLGGVRIGRNAVIAAGSVVTQSVAANEIWGGNPARRLRAIDATPEAE